jgi:hypothetical protein
MIPRGVTVTLRLVCYMRELLRRRFFWGDQLKPNSHSTTRRTAVLAVCTLGILFALSANSARADNVAFNDTTFNLANYSSPVIYNNNPGNPAITVSTDPTGDSAGTGPALDFNYSYTGVVTGSLTVTGLLNNGWVYNPGTEGAINGIDFSADKNLASTFTISSVTAPALLSQDGNYYFDFILGSPVSGYQTISASGLTAADFGLYDFATGTYNTAVNPNFTGTGDAITFGIGNRQNGNTGGSLVLNAFFDDVSWDVNPTATPEPSSLLLLGAGLAMLALLRRSLARVR